MLPGFDMFAYSLAGFGAGGLIHCGAPVFAFLAQSFFGTANVFSHGVIIPVRPGVEGWGNFNADIFERLDDDLAAPTICAHAIAEFMAVGGYDPYLRRRRGEYARRVAAMFQAVRRYFPEESRLTRPSGGYLLWVQLPESFDAL